ncbi:MAG: FAD binding domain-containing protein [Rhizobiales bacterium]|nr:FAD binding domain-containing protein [Hyphomicrobiales bacterium]
MRDFIYHRPNDLAEAEALFGASAEGRYLAGGMTLIPTMKQGLAAPADLIDLSGIAELGGIAVENGELVIGATVRHADVQESAVVAKVIPALAALAAGIGDPQVRHRGTIGGSIANFFLGLFTTALEEGEIVRRIRLPIPERAAYAKFPNPASRYAMAGVFVAIFADGVRVAVTGAGQDGVYRAFDMEEALAAELNPAAIEAVVVEPDGMLADLHASAAYRANLVKVMAKRAVAAILA